MRTPAPSAMERRRNAALAGHQGDAAGARLHLRDEDPTVRASALRGLQRADGLTADELEAALEDPDPAVRMAALELAEARRDVPVAAVTARLADEDQRVVEAAAWACGERLGGRSDDDGAGARRDAAETVSALVGVACDHADPLCRESAIAALGAIGDPAGLGAILAGLDDKPAVRRRAVIALAPFDGPRVDAALTKASADRDKQVRAAAAELRSL